MTANRTLAEALQALEGEQLSSVEFVQDYVQLRFDGPRLNVYTPHRITSGESTISWGEPGYCDALCKLIGRIVRKAQISEGENLSFSFDGPFVWSMSLRDSDYHGPEALYYVDGTGQSWVA